MEFTKEMIEKAKSAKNAEELAKMAKDTGMELSAEEAEKAFAELHKSGELSDEELDNVSGGCSRPTSSGSGDTPKYKVGDNVYYFIQTRSLTGLPMRKRKDAVILEVRDKKYGYFYYKVTDDVVLPEYELRT